MGVRIQRVNPLDVREAAIDFFWRMRAWPFPTKEEYARCWDWRYTSIPETDPTIWIAVDGDRVIGHVACNMRRLRHDGHPVLAGVPGNYLVDPEYRNSIIGAQLASAPMKLALRGEIDIFLGYGNKIAHALALGLGCRELGPMRPFIDVRDWTRALGRRFAAAQLLGPLADLIAGATRFVAGRRRAAAPAGLAAREFSEAEVVALDRARWKAPSGLSWNGESRYLARRFLRCPIRSYRAFGIVDEATAATHGIVICEGTARLNVIQCETDQGVLTEAQAVELAVRSAPEAQVVIVPMLPGTDLARSFAQTGYIERSYKHSDAVLRNTAWSALWRAAHPLAAVFAEQRPWTIWYGWNSH